MVLTTRPQLLATQLHLILSQNILPQNLLLILLQNPPLILLLNILLLNILLLNILLLNTLLLNPTDLPNPYILLLNILLLNPSIPLLSLKEAKASN
jgi:hypothetical protein